jgi:hypothetical protein
MERYVQVSVTIGGLGVVIALIGLFPGIAGLETVGGVGVLQVLVILLGFGLLFLGAYIFARWGLYPGLPLTLAQDVGIRLTLTGLLIAGAAGLADVLGFGSHPVSDESRPLLGDLQAAVFICGFLIASSGVIIFALFGPVPEGEEDDSSEYAAASPPESTKILESAEPPESSSR